MKTVPRPTSQQKRSGNEFHFSAEGEKETHEVKIILINI